MPAGVLLAGLGVAAVGLTSSYAATAALREPGSRADAVLAARPRAALGEAAQRR